jgi:hypothetical protein
MSEQTDQPVEKVANGWAYLTDMLLFTLKFCPSGVKR